ncbi:hypothetical protein SDC9_200487 [bioreactor metagenome]|uniref:Uncharacterized protein n=1 Tax=bioreactor metagenome TaxID=1076179 RepID=A0A645IWT4_9ZZZZ
MNQDNVFHHPKSGSLNSFQSFFDTHVRLDDTLS